MDRDAGNLDRGDEARQADPGLAAEPVVDQESYERDPGAAAQQEQEGVYDQEADQDGR
jgi:hypothetical protein